MSVTLDAERIWNVHCDHPDCGRRTYAQAETPQAAVERAVQSMAWVKRGGRIWCPFHGRVSRG